MKVGYLQLHLLKYAMAKEVTCKEGLLKGTFTLILSRCNSPLNSLSSLMNDPWTPLSRDYILPSRAILEPPLKEISRKMELRLFHYGLLS